MLLALAIGGSPRYASDPKTREQVAVCVSVPGRIRVNLYSDSLLSMSSSKAADDEDSESTLVPPFTDADGSGSKNQVRSGIFDNGFEAYRTVTDDEYRTLFATGLIVLDANVLLDLYRYHPETRRELLDVLDQLRERLWIPNQVMAEFWTGREDVLEDASDIASTVRALDKISEQYISRVREWVNRAGLRDRAADNLIKISRSAFDATVLKIRSLAGDKALEIAKDTTKDSIVIRLDSILQGRVGNPLSADRKRAAINQEAPQRFADKQPPGYMDANKKNGNSVGDYLIWIETLAESARLKVDVLFVTGDTKEDWWRQERGQAKGPHPQLVGEMQEVAGVRLFMLRPASFLKHAGDLLELKVSPESVEDAQRVSAQVDAGWHAMSVETEVTDKLSAVFGKSRISPPELYMAVFNTGNLRPDVVLDLPGKVPVIFEVKYVSRPAAPSRHTSEVLRRIDQAASAINGRGALVVVVSNDFSSQDIERWVQQIEERSRDLAAILHPIYISRYSDFLAESAQGFVDRVIPSSYLLPVDD